MKKIFLTGVTGFIGRNLKELFDGKYEIIAPRHDELDLLDSEKVEQFLKKNQLDVVIHSSTHDASRNSKKDLTLVFHNNLRMFFNIARLNRYYGRMFYFGSGAEYDKEHYIPKMKEEYFDTHVPNDDYGFSKYISAKFILASENIYDLRLFGCFGRYEDWKIRFISNACCKAMYDLDITIKQNVFFDYLYINDLGKIMKWFIEREKLQYRFYNICTGQSIDLKTLAQKVKRISKKKVKIIIKESGFKKEYSGDNKRLLNEMSEVEVEFTPIDKAIKELYLWYEENKQKIKPENLLYDK